jgi:hypothetical protein
MPLLDREQIKGWKAVFSQDGGWLAAAKAINAIGLYLRDQGVKFRFGSAGSFKQPLLAEGVCVGVDTVDGTRYYADKVVLAAGAWSPVLVDLEEQCVSKVRLHITSLQFSANVLSGLGIRTHPAHPRRSRRIQKRPRGLQRRCRLLLRTRRIRCHQSLRRVPWLYALQATSAVRCKGTEAHLCAAFGCEAPYHCHFSAKVHGEGIVQSTSLLVYRYRGCSVADVRTS